DNLQPSESDFEIGENISGPQGEIRHWGDPQSMWTQFITRIVAFCVGRPWLVIAVAIAVTAGTGIYAQQHFAIHTNIEDLISPDLPWSKRGQQFAKDFPQRDLLVVLDAPTPELV